MTTSTSADSDLFEPVPQTIHDCVHPERPCTWLTERRQFERRLMRLEEEIVGIKSQLAVGSERFTNAKESMSQIAALERDLHRLTIVVEKLAQTVGLLKTIIFGGICVVLVSILGATLTLIIKD